VISSALAVAPLRVSFVGGGTDIESFYRRHEGVVVSCAINKYVYVHAKIHNDSFGERYRISYSQVEHAQEIAQIENLIVRKCLEFMRMDVPLQISTLSDLPSGTGLGSSSSFTTALLLALHTLKGSRPTKYQIAEEACFVEIELSKHPIGKQDQFAAAFGGLNLFRFKRDGRVVVEPICIMSEQLSELLKRCTLHWTKVERSSVKILKDQAERTVNNFENLNKMSDFALSFRNTLEHETVDWAKLANLISHSWILKRELSPLVTSEKIDNLVENIISKENYAAKVLGAGGGGFVLGFNGGMEFPPIVDSSSGGSSNSFIPGIDDQGVRIISTF